MTESSRRRSLVPRYAIIAAAVIVVLVGAGVSASLYVARSQLVEVPDVEGLAKSAAQAVLADVGLEWQTSGTQVSVNVPAGRIISQDPAAGSLVDPGTVVGVVVSVGRQTITVPDLLGQPLQEARAELVSLGLDVEVSTISSEVTSTIVLEMYPAPGVAVNVGDLVRLTIPGTAPSTTALLPFDMNGVAVVLDPVPLFAPDDPDVAMDVSRRLRALLEASGATVTVTRTATDTAPPPAARLATARASGAVVFVGIDLGRGGIAGFTALRLADQVDDPARTEQSRLLAQAITRAARIPGLLVNEPAPSSDAVLFGFPGTGVRVVIADVGAASDQIRIQDPDWADQVARAIYRGLGTQFGSE